MVHRRADGRSPRGGVCNGLFPRGFPRFLRLLALRAGWSTQAATCSYGWNAEDNVYRLNGKVLALDYYQNSADWRKDNWSATFPGKSVLPFARHMNMVNVLWSDGTAYRVSPDSIKLPGIAQTQNRYWKPIKQ